MLPQIGRLHNLFISLILTCGKVINTILQVENLVLFSARIAINSSFHLGASEVKLGSSIEKGGGLGPWKKVFAQF